jgi:hypothetical protein
VSSEETTGKFDKQVPAEIEILSSWSWDSILGALRLVPPDNSIDPPAPVMVVSFGITVNMLSSI